MMPEGPSIYLLREAVQPFKHQTILAAGGNTQVIDTPALVSQEIVDFKSWGKHFLICLSGYSLRIHLLMFGSYTINKPKPMVPRLYLEFQNGRLYFYACSIIRINEALDDIYDWSSDVMNTQWNPAKARNKLQKFPDRLICDALLDQNIFAGVGNIMKNEILFRTRIHPESRITKIPVPLCTDLLNDTVTYAFAFLSWKRDFVLKKHWEAYRQKTCPRDHVPLQRSRLGQTNRISYYCPLCQQLYR